MARPYSVDLRWRIVRAVEAGLSRRAAAAKFEVSVSFVVKLMQRWRDKGTLQPERIGGAKRSPLAAHAARVHALLAAAPDLTIAELRGRLAAPGHHDQPLRAWPLPSRRRPHTKNRPSTPPSRP